MTFEEWVKFILQSNVIAALIVGLFGLLTLKLGIAKFASERWWERKAASYAAVIDGLHAIHRASFAYAEAFDSKQELDNDYSDELVAGSVAGHVAVERGENIGSFLMTERAAQILKQLRLDLEALGMHFGEVHRKHAELVSAAIVAMTVEAKRDLKT